MNVIMPTKEQALEVILAKIGYRDVESRKQIAKGLIPNWSSNIYTKFHEPKENEKGNATSEFHFIDSYRLPSIDGTKTIEFYTLPINVQTSSSIWYQPVIHAITDHKNNNKTYKIEKIKFDNSSDEHYSLN